MIYVLLTWALRLVRERSRGLVISESTLLLVAAFWDSITRDGGDEEPWLHHYDSLEFELSLLWDGSGTFGIGTFEPKIFQAGEVRALESNTPSSHPLALRPQGGQV